MSEIQQTINGVMTGLLLILFIGICVWSWSSKRKDSFDRMAHLPLEDGAMNSNETHSDTESRAIEEKREASV